MSGHAAPACEAGHSRKRAMAILAEAHPDELEAAFRAYAHIEAATLRAPETGLVMVRGRIGGGGAPFNLGEATTTRASVQLDTGEIGHAYALGSDGEAVRLAAIFDALWQRQPDDIERQVLAPIAERIGRQDAQKAGETAATRVNFFTMVRGDD